MSEASRCILVVDDEDVVREVIEATLRSGGYRVECAANGVDGLRKFEAAPEAYSLAIVDRRMPGLDGAVLIEKMRALRADLPILFASGGVDPAPGLERLPGPPIQALNKPFRPAGLLMAVAEQIGKPPKLG
jgi:CheY-like chemotaxis protein